MSSRHAGRSGKRGSNPGTHIPLLYSFGNGPWYLTVPYARGTEISLWAKQSECDLTNQLHSVPRLGMHGATPPLPLLLPKAVIN